VRANGYADDYRRFVEEWFCDFDVKIISSGSVKDLLANVDLFITFYSQTLFEASCLGIPCIFHKADEEVMDPPFDGRSEIVTTTSVDELRAAVLDFLAGHKRFDSFLRYEVMEKYIGPLDGRSLRRNHLEVCRMMGLALTEKS
jgi:CDP-glycerol glycerophosphotransferase (TagB/SpsB family)